MLDAEQAALAREREIYDDGESEEEHLEYLSMYSGPTRMFGTLRQHSAT